MIVKDGGLYWVWIYDSLSIRGERKRIKEEEDGRKGRTSGCL